MNNLTVFEQDGVLVVDSRLVAARLNIEHESLMRNLKKFQTQIESRFGQVRFENGDGTPLPQGGKTPPTKYALLTEPQATVLMTMSRNTDEVVECKLDLVEAFEKAKKVIKEISNASGQPYWYRRMMLYREKTKIPVGYFSIFEEIISLIGDLEANGYVIPTGCIPDISVGKCWAFYLQNVEKINPKNVGKKYKHYYPDWAYPIDAFIYPLELLPKFRIWMEKMYKPLKMVEYFRKKDPSALPSVCKLLGLPEGK